MIQKSGVTVQTILQLDCLRNSKVVAGYQGLERIISNVNVMEVPDIVPWVHPGDLLLTTAYSIRNDINALADLVPKLAAKDLAGLVLKPKRYLDKIPEDMIKHANDLNFPLIELPTETSFSEIINSILTEILQFQTIYFKKSEQAHRLFMEVILKGGRLDDIAKTLAKLVDNSVIIQDNNKEILAKYLVNWSEQELISATNLSHKLDTENVDPLKSGVNYLKTIVTVTPPLHQYITEIIGRGQTHGHLTVWNNNRPLNTNDFIFIDRAMSIAALEILNEKSLVEIERRYRNEFLDDLLRDPQNEINLKGLVERAFHLGWDLTIDYVSFVFDIDEFSKFAAIENEPTIQKAKENLFHYIIAGLNPDDNYIAGTKSDSIILFLARPLEHKGKTLNEYFNRRAEELLAFCQNKIQDFTVSVGVGRFYPGIKGLRKSFSEALKALEIGKDLLGHSLVINFNNLGIYRLLHLVKDLDELNQFYKETIFPLDLHDNNGNSDMVKTLKVYFECNGNIKKVSEKLFLHYNTALYRVERIQQITQFNLNLPEHRLNLQVGLKIRDILRENKRLDTKIISLP